MLISTGCKTPKTVRYSPQWELKTTVATSEVPVGVSLERIDDAPLPPLDGSDPLATTPPAEIVPTDGAPPLPGSWSVSGGIAERSVQSSAPGTQHPAEPPMPEAGKTSAVANETLLALDAPPVALPSPTATAKSSAPLPIVSLPPPAKDSAKPEKKKATPYPALTAEELPPVVEPAAIVKKPDAAKAAALAATTSAPATTSAASVTPATTTAKVDLTEILLLAKEVESRHKPKSAAQ